MDLTPLEKALTNIRVADQKISGIDATLGKVMDKLERIPAIERGGQRIECSVASRQLHEARDILNKMWANIENARDQLQAIHDNETAQHENNWQRKAQ